MPVIFLLINSIIKKFYIELNQTKQYSKLKTYVSTTATDNLKLLLKYMSMNGQYFPQTAVYNSQPTYQYQIQLVLYMNQQLKMSPSDMRQKIFMQEIFKYSSAKFFLKKWDYRIDMYFETKNHRQVAIQEIKRLKTNYGVSYHYDLKKNPLMGKYLMDQREYYRVIDQSARLKLQQKQSSNIDIQLPQNSIIEGRRNPQDQQQSNNKQQNNNQSKIQVTLHYKAPKSLFVPQNNISLENTSRMFNKNLVSQTMLQEQKAPQQKLKLIQEQKLMQQEQKARQKKQRLMQQEQRARQAAALLLIQQQRLQALKKKQKQQRIANILSNQPLLTKIIEYQLKMAAKNRPKVKNI